MGRKLRVLNFRMAENEEVEEVNQNKDNTKDGQKAAAALDKVTDHVEEKETEISTASEQILKFYFSISLLSSDIENILKTSESKRGKTEEIKIKKADIDLIVREIEVRPSNVS